MKTMSLFGRTCGASKLNPRVLLFDGHDSHSDDRGPRFIRSQQISPFNLKAGNSTNFQTNENVPNLKLKRYYGKEKLKCQRQHGTIKFTHALTNSVLVEMWHLFQQKPASVFIEAFKKTNLPPLYSPDHDTNTQ